MEPAISRFAILLRLGLCWFLVSSALAKDALESKSEQTYPLSRHGSLTVANTDGSICLYGWDREEVKVIATKRSYSQDRLARIVVDVKSEPDSLVINTSFPERSGWFGDKSGTVDYVVMAPREARLTELAMSNGEIVTEGMRGNVKAKLVNGRLLTNNSFADLDLSVVNGTLDMTYDWWEGKPFTVKARTTNGNLSASVPNDASFRFKARTVNGGIKSEFDSKEEARLNDSKGVRDGVVGTEAVVTLELKTTNGNIKFKERY